MSENKNTRFWYDWYENEEVGFVFSLVVLVVFVSTIVLKIHYLRYLFYLKGGDGLFRDFGEVMFDGHFWVLHGADFLAGGLVNAFFMWLALHCGYLSVRRYKNRKAGKNVGGNVVVDVIGFLFGVLTVLVVVRQMFVFT